jgi:hypothetical protein
VSVGILTMSEDYNPTKGHKKMVEYLKQLSRNNVFQRELKELRKLYKKDFDKYNKKLITLCEKYDLEFNLFTPLLELFREDFNEKSLEKDWKIDVCRVDDLRDFYESEEYSEGVDYKTFLIAYPIAIRISPRATKNEVLDYIEKNWSLLIEPQLSTYSENKRTIFKNRRKQKLFDRIAELNNKELSISEIVNFIDKEFPEEYITKHEVSNIINQIKNRRSNPIK